MPLSPLLPRLKPPALRTGDRVAIVAPASPFKRPDFEAGRETLSHMGYQTVYEESIFSHDLYFAGSARRRAQELEQMFLREDVKAIVCARGGYGSNYLLPLLDVEKIRAHPKIFVGSSDNTSLLTHLLDAAGLVTFHGPMLAKDFRDVKAIDRSSWHAALGGEKNWRLDFGPETTVKPLSRGSAEGPLYGGCLSLLTASLGTPYEVRTEGTIMFIEDIAAKPYQIDRMLMQLRLAGKLKQVRGFVFGEMLDCVQPGNQDYALADIIMRVIGDLATPVAWGLPSGHVSRQNITLPIGVRVRLSVEESRVSVEFLESATAA